MRSAFPAAATRAAAGVLFLILAGCGGGMPSDPRIVFERVPNGGIQPQGVADRAGNVHIVYFHGDPNGGDLFYSRRSADGRYTNAIRVNSQPRSSVAVGTVRGGQLALGRDDRVHVVWNGSEHSTPRLPIGMPVFYTRLNSGAFEPQRSLLTWSGFLDGGATVAADARGQVYVAWHSNPGDGADARASVFLARSNDDGATFAREEQISDDSLGACGCCSMRGLVDGRSVLHIAYRTAGGNVHRDATLLTSNDEGRTFAATQLQPWQIGACPMSTFALAEGPAGPAVAWDTAGQVFARFAGHEAVAAPASRPARPGENPAQKHPVLAFNRDGDLLLAWLEGTGHRRGGSVAWQVYDRHGAPTPSAGIADGVPVWGLAAAAALPDGRFLLLY